MQFLGLMYFKNDFMLFNVPQVVHIAKEGGRSCYRLCDPGDQCRVESGLSAERSCAGEENRRVPCMGSSRETKHKVLNGDQETVWGPVRGSETVGCVHRTLTRSSVLRERERRRFLTWVAGLAGMQCAENQGCFGLHQMRRERKRRGKDLRPPVEGKAHVKYSADVQCSGGSCERGESLQGCVCERVPQS